MASPASISLIVLSLAAAFLIPAAQSQSADPPAPAGPIDIYAILKKAGGYSSFIRLLNETQIGTQINNQVNSSTEGMTVFAPSDNAFNNLPAGTLNDLSIQQHVQLGLYHVLPKFYSVEGLQTVSNPVRTQATGQDGGVFGLNFTGTQGNQVNVSTGIVSVPIYNTIRKDFPLAIYQVDEVLLPKEFYEAKPPVPAPPTANGTTGGGSGGGAKAPATSNPGNGAGQLGVGLGLMGGVWLLCMTILS